MRLNHRHCWDLMSPRQHHQHAESPAEVACGFISPAQFIRLMYLAQQGLDHSVPVLLQVKIRSEIQANGSSCSPKTDRHDIVTEPRAAAADSSDCHERHWGPFSTGLVWLGSEEAAPQPYSAAPRNLFLPHWTFYQVGFRKSLYFPPYSREKLSPAGFVPRIPLGSSAGTWFQGCNLAVLPWLGGKVGMRCPPALPVPLHCGHRVRKYILGKNASKHLLKY